MDGFTERFFLRFFLKDIPSIQPHPFWGLHHQNKILSGYALQLLNLPQSKANPLCYYREAFCFL